MKRNWLGTTLAALALFQLMVYAGAAAAQQETLAEADELNQRVVSLYRQGRFAEALPLAERVLEIRERLLPSGHADIAQAVVNLAEQHRRLGHFDESKELYTRALAMAKAPSANPQLRVTVLNNLGEQYYLTGEWDRSQELLEEAERNGKVVFGETHPFYVSTLNNLAALYVALGQYEKAAQLYTRVLDFQTAAAANGPNPQLAITLNNVGELFTLKGDHEKAYEAFKRANKYLADNFGEDSSYYALTLNNLAVVSKALGKYDEAERAYLRSSEIRKALFGEAHPDYASSLNNLAGLYVVRGKYDEAERAYLRALGIYKQLSRENSPVSAHVWRNLAELYEETGRPARALAAMSSGMEIEQRNIERVLAVSSESAMRDYIAQDDGGLYMLLSIAADSGERAAGEAALDWTLRRKGVIIDTLVRLRGAERLAARDPELAALMRRVAGLRQQLSDLPLRAPEGTDAASLQAELARLREEGDRVEADINRRLSALRQGQGEAVAASVEAVRRVLPPDSALVEFVKYHPFDFKAKGERRWRAPRYRAFILTALAPVRSLDLGDAEAIDGAVLEVRDSIAASSKFFHGKTEEEVRAAERDREDGYRELSRNLYDLVFKPVRAELGKAATVYLATDGQLSLVPFEGMTDEGGKYLVESYKFVSLSSGRDLLRQPAPAGAGAVVFADPDYGMDAARRAAELRGGNAAGARVPGATFTGELSHTVTTRGGGSWPRLEYSPREAADVERLLSGSVYGPVTTLLGGRALEERFKALRAPRVLHVATHGFFLEDEPDGAGGGLARLEEAALAGQERLRATGAENPLLRSGLVLAGANRLGERGAAGLALDDGWVTAEEIAQMDLRGTELVVLSACETGLGDVRTGEGVYGLRRAFVLAGARTLVATLFKVTDAESAEFMRDFYGALKAGKGKLDALHETQLKTIAMRRQRGGAAHPFFWASFVLAGDPS